MDAFFLRGRWPRVPRACERWGVTFNASPMSPDTGCSKHYQPACACAAIAAWPILTGLFFVSRVPEINRTFGTFVSVLLAAAVVGWCGAW